MSLNYLKEHPQIVTYDLYYDEKIKRTFRGPRPLEGSKLPKICFLGAAQVFGAFVHHPFPNVLSEMLSAQNINFSHGGAGPEFYLNNLFIDKINKSSCAVIQVMSARSSMNNSWMKSVEGLASVEITQGFHKGKKVLGHHAFKLISEEAGIEKLRQISEETMINYKQRFVELLEKITVPKVLLYVSRRAPLERPIFEEKDENLAEPGIHPHYICNETLNYLEGFADDLLILHSKEGAERKLVNQFTQSYERIVRSPTYTVKDHSAYISPYLHNKIAHALYPILSPLTTS